MNYVRKWWLTQKWWLQFIAIINFWEFRKTDMRCLKQLKSSFCWIQQNTSILIKMFLWNDFESLVSFKKLAKRAKYFFINFPFCISRWRMKWIKKQYAVFLIIIQFAFKSLIYSIKDIVVFPSVIIVWNSIVKVILNHIVENYFILVTAYNNIRL